MKPFLSRAFVMSIALCALVFVRSTMARADDPLPGDSVYHLGSTWTRQDGTQIKLAQFAGRPQVVAMIYTSCRTTCPTTISALQRIERALPEKQRGRVGFVLVSFDPARDTPPVLARLAGERKLDPARWTLLRGDDSAVRGLAVVLGFHYRKAANGDFIHDSIITLLDERGVARERTTDLNVDPVIFLRALR